MCKGTAFFLHGKRQAFVRKNDGFRTKKERILSGPPFQTHFYAKDSFEFLALRLRRSGCRFVNQHRLRTIGSGQGEVNT